MIDIRLAKNIYRSAVDPSATDHEGAKWWEIVRSEMQDVLDAPTIRDAAKIISWWHLDWGSVGNTPHAVATRIRQEYDKHVSRETFVKQ